MTTLSIVVFDDFSDIDLVIPLDILNRVKRPDWRVNVVGMSSTHRSTLGLLVPTDAPLETVKEADVVLILGGEGSRVCIQSQAFLERLSIDPKRQLIGAQCSGALILATLGFLEGRTATTTPFAAKELSLMGVELLNRPLVVHGNVATAGGCLASLYMTTWILHRCVGIAETRRIFREVTPVGEDERFLEVIESVMAVEQLHKETL